MKPTISLTLTLLPRNESQSRVTAGTPVLQGCFYEVQEQLLLDAVFDVSLTLIVFELRACGLQYQSLSHDSSQKGDKYLQLTNI